MNKEPKPLPQAIKTVVESYGKNVLNDVQLVNVLNDVVELEDSLAVKNTLRELIKLGFGRKILALVSAKGDNMMKIRVYAKGIADTQGYNETIVQYVLYSLAYSVGICQEPYLKNVEAPTRPKRKEVSNISSSEIKEDKARNTTLYRVILGLFVMLFLSGGYYLFQFVNSSDAREQFDKRVFSGNTFLAEGDYDNAIESYKEAYNGYNALNSNSYKEAALFRMDDLIDKLLDDGETNSKSLLQAHRAIQSEMELNLEKDDYSRLQAKKESIENMINKKVSNGRNSLITNISANKGKLDDNGKQLLEELLLLSPNDYWLNFIKGKEK